MGRLDTLWAMADQSPWLCYFFPIGADHTQTIVLGCVGGIVAVGLGLVLAYRLSVEIYDRREFRRFEKEWQRLNWKQVGKTASYPAGLSLVRTSLLSAAHPLPPSPGSFHLGRPLTLVCTSPGPSRC